MNSKYDPIKAQILGKEIPPSLFKVFYIVRGEETRWIVKIKEPLHELPCSLERLPISGLQILET